MASSTRAARGRARRTPAAFAAVMTGALLGVACTPGTEPASEPPNIVLVLLDTVRADHVGAYGYERPTTPNIDALGEAGVLFESAVSQAPWTAASVASLFTGLYPSVHGLDEGPDWESPAGDPEHALPFRTQKILAESNETLAELLRARGYRTAGFVSNAYMHSVFGFGQGFEVYDDSHDDYADDVFGAKRRGSDTDRRVYEWLDAGPPEPFFLLVHYNDAHWPYNPPPPFGEEFVAGYEGQVTPAKTGWILEQHGRPLRGVSPEDLRYVIGLYDGELQYVDSRVGLLTQKLATLGLARPLVTVVTSDHGEEFLDHGATSHGYTLFDELIRVPLIVHAPELFAPRRVAAQVSSIDLFSTLLDLAEVERRPVLEQGRSLLALLRGETDRGPPLAFSEATYARGPSGRLEAVRTAGGLKLIRPQTPPDAGARKGGALLFDLRADERELDNLAGRSPEGARLRELMGEWKRINRSVAEALRDGSSSEVVLDEEMLERLRALGYVD